MKDHVPGTTVIQQTITQHETTTDQQQTVAPTQQQFHTPTQQQFQTPTQQHQVQIFSSPLLNDFGYTILLNSKVHRRRPGNVVIRRS